MAKLVEQVMDNTYSFWPTEMQSLVEWAANAEQIQSVGVLYSLERALAIYEETNQEYVAGVLRKLHDRVTGIFHRFIEEQVKSIVETRVKLKKRKGIISFMRTFPAFSAAVESMLPTETGHETPEVRFLVNDAYAKINKAMWESLNFIAREDQGAASGGVSTSYAGADPEDKEALNFHILHIENMNHYIEEVETQSNVVLEEWKAKASHDLYTHLHNYTDAIIRRPLGKWLDFLESTESLMKSTDIGSYATIASKPSHGRSTAKKILSSYDAKEVRKGAETLKKRVEKHFGDVDEPGSSKSLVSQVYDGCSLKYTSAYDRMKTVIDTVYENNLEIDWRKEEVATMFMR